MSKTFYKGHNRDVYLENQLNRKPRGAKFKKNSAIVIGKGTFDYETVPEYQALYNTIDDSEPQK